MSEPPEQTVNVNAQERAHPTIRQLARACIALARQLAPKPSPATTNPAPILEATATPAKEEPHA